ncbi:MAG: PAS domain-containing protein [Myxococcota bacterium]|nr:PAS domain-containing protein [Myxococcota bacterium]
MSPATPTESDRAIADAMPHIVWINDADNVVSYFNQKWTEYTGLALADTLAVGPGSCVHPDDLAVMVALFARSQESGTAVEATYRLRGHEGAYRWHFARVVPFRRTGAKVASWLGTATDIHERHLLEQEREYLVQSTRVLGTSLDLEKTLADVARLLVPQVADWCAIDLVTPTGVVTRPAVAHVDPSKVELAWELWRRAPPKPTDPQGLYAVLRTGTPELTREITDAMLVAGLPDPELLALYRGLGLRSAMLVPLPARGRVVGALTLVSAEGGRLFDDRDLAFATELAARIATAVDNSQLYGEAMRARHAAEAIAQEVQEQNATIQAAFLELRRERDDALAARTRES